MVDTDLINLHQFAKRGSIDKIFIPLGNLKSITFFLTLTLLPFDSGFAFFLTKEKNWT